MLVTEKSSSTRSVILIFGLTVAKLAKEDESRGGAAERAHRSLTPGLRVAEGKFELEELSGIMHFPSHAKELSFSEVGLLPVPESSDENGVLLFMSGQVRVWSEYYKSSFIFADAAGQGAYGEVWRGYLQEGGFRTKVVLKRIFPKKGLPVISASMREVYYGSVLGLNRPHLSRLISHFVEDNDLWLVFHDEGISLYQAVFHPVFLNGLSMMYRSSFWEQSRADPTITANIMKQVLLGLEELHSLNITHRDIKLENILIDPKTFHVRIGDLGSAARGSDDAHLQASLFPPSGPSLAEETNRYAPPERSEDQKLFIDPSFDMWCVGIMWLEMILGSVDLGLDDPRRGICVRTVDCKDLADRIKRRDPLKTGITDENVFDLISKLLSFDPTQRPTAREALKHPVFTQHGRFPLSLLEHEKQRVVIERPVDTWKSQGGRTDMEDQLVMRSKNGMHLACVFDGHNGGGISEFLAKRFPELVFEENEGISLSRSIVTVTAEVSEHDEFGGMEGSTLSCVLVDEKTGQVHAANIGDSRILVVESSKDNWKPAVGGRVKFGGPNHEKSGTVVEIRDGYVIVSPDGQENRKTVARNAIPESRYVITRQVTIDHKPDVPSELAYIESQGGYVSDSIPARVNGVLAISRSVGVRDLQKVIRNEADFFDFPITESVSRIVIATDGVWDVLSNQEVGELSFDGAQAIVERATQKSARDNMAVVVLTIKKAVESRENLNDEL